MTPWQLKICVAGAIDREEIAHDHGVWIMWHTAALFRFNGKKLPDIKQFMSGSRKKQVPQIDENAIMARLRAYQHQVDEKSKEQGKAK